MPESLQRGRWKGLVATALLCLFWAAGAQAASPNTAPPVTAAKAPTEPPALLLPVQGVAASDLRNTFDDGRDGGQRGHEAIDILAPTGTPVLAADDGRIVKLFLSQPGGITVYQFDPSGQFAYYYAHLERYADGLREGQMVRRGQVIGHVGDTGNARGTPPHLHYGLYGINGARNPHPLLRDAPDDWE